MRILIFFTLILFYIPSIAQDEMELSIGDTLYFGNCNGEAYTYIDLYVKTRFEKDSISYDSIDGWNFYNRFFGFGDFDVSRMPCSYKDKYGIIKHMMAVQNEDGDLLNIVIVMIEDGKSAGYMIEDAFIHEEVLASPVQ